MRSTPMISAVGCLLMLALAACGSQSDTETSSNDRQPTASATQPTAASAEPAASAAPSETRSSTQPPASVAEPATSVEGAVPAETQSSPPSSATTSASDAAPAIVGTVVRFASNAASVDVTLGEDNPAARDLLSMLPMTLNVEEFSGREKISYLPRELEHQGSPGSDPESGDLIYFVPWGNLGFYYNAEGIGYSDDTIHLGTYDASLAELQRRAKSPSTSSADA